MKPPTLLSLTIDSALLHIARITDLSAVPDPILVELFQSHKEELVKERRGYRRLILGFQKTLSAGKLTEKVLKLFMSTGSEEILLFVESLNIKQILIPILPTRCSEKF